MNVIPEKSSLARSLALGLGAVGLTVLGLLRLKPDFFMGLAHCPLRDAIGLPCPTCGGTHAAVALAAGDIEAALVANPLVAVSAVLFGLWMLWALVALAVPRLRVALVLSPREKKAARIGAALLLIGTWIWEIVHR